MLGSRCDQIAAASGFDYFCHDGAQRARVWLRAGPPRGTADMPSRMHVMQTWWVNSAFGGGGRRTAGVGAAGKTGRGDVAVIVVTVVVVGCVAVV